MPIPRLPHARAARVSAGLILLACAAGSACAQAVFRHVDANGQTTYSDRREAPIARRALAPLPGQTGPDAEIRGRSPDSSAARSQFVNRREAQRRLAQAERERARGPDMQQGIPPLAERAPGERRRARVEALQHMVESAQARVRELDAPAAIALVALDGAAKQPGVIARE